VIGLVGIWNLRRTAWRSSHSEAVRTESTAAPATMGARALHT